MGHLPLDHDLMLKAFADLETRLEAPTHLVIGGGAAMVLAYDHPLSTQDVDAFTAKGSITLAEVDAATKATARALDIEPDWLNPHFETYTPVLPRDYAARLKRVYAGDRLTVDALGPEESARHEVLRGAGQGSAARPGAHAQAGARCRRDRIDTSRRSWSAATAEPRPRRTSSTTCATRWVCEGAAQSRSDAARARAALPRARARGRLVRRAPQRLALSAREPGAAAGPRGRDAPLQSQAALHSGGVVHERLALAEPHRAPASHARDALAAGAPGGLRLRASSATR